MSKNILILVLSLCLGPTVVVAAESKPKSAKDSGHKHEEKKGHKQSEDEHHDDDDEEDHKHGEGEEHHDEKSQPHKEGDEHKGEDKYAHEENENPSVGPDKGVTEANEKTGFKLSVEAEKNFGIQTKAFSGGQVTLPRKAIFFGLQELNIYRQREGFYKRIDFVAISKSKSEFVISSHDLKSGDLIVVEGLGFLRIAEIAAFGGVSHGHSH